MRTTLSSVLAVVMALALLSATATAGGGDRTGTSGSAQLLIPVGARGIALGSSYSAGISGLNAIYYNPAGLSASKHSAEATFSHMQSFGDMGVDYAAVGAQFQGFGYLAFSVKSLSFGDIDLTDERNPDGTGATWSPTFVALGLTNSRALTDRIRAGVTAAALGVFLPAVPALAMAAATWLPQVLRARRSRQVARQTGSGAGSSGGKVMGRGEGILKWSGLSNMFRAFSCSRHSANSRRIFFSGPKPCGWSSSGKRSARPVRARSVISARILLSMNALPASTLK